MKLNPITALSDLFSKLVIEHGSAVIQEKQIALLKDQFAILEKENTDLKAKGRILETNNQNLKFENDDLKKKIQIYEKPTHSNPLGKIEVNILLYLAKQKDEVKTDNMAQALNIDRQTAPFYLKELENRKMVHGRYASGMPVYWSLAHEGRRYLIENKLIS